MPYGYDTWLELHDYWKNNIVSKLRKHCHQSRRFNPVAWVSCEEEMDKTKLNYFIGNLFNLTNSVYLNNPTYLDFISTINKFSPKNWAKINSGYAALPAFVAVIFVMLGMNLLT